MSRGGRSGLFTVCVSHGYTISVNIWIYFRYYDFDSYVREFRRQLADSGDGEGIGEVKWDSRYQLKKD